MRDEADLDAEKALVPEQQDDDGQYGDDLQIRAARPGEYDHVGDEDASPDRNGDDEDQTLEGGNQGHQQHQRQEDEDHI